MLDFIALNLIDRFKTGFIAENEKLRKSGIYSTIRILTKKSY